MIKGGFRNSQLEIAQAAFRVFNRLIQDHADVASGERFQFEYPRSADEWADQVKERVFGSRADQGNRPDFDMWKQCILL